MKILNVSKPGKNLSKLAGKARVVKRTPADVLREARRRDSDRKRDQVFRSIQPFLDAEVELDIVQLAPICVFNVIAYDVLNNAPPPEDADPDNPDFQAWTPDWNAQDHRWKQILQIGRDCKLAEGATWRTFPDAPHFYPQELPATPTDAMRAAFAQGGMPAVWTIIDGLIGSAN